MSVRSSLVMRLGGLGRTWCSRSAPRLVRGPVSAQVHSNAAVRRSEIEYLIVRDIATADPTVYENDWLARSSILVGEIDSRFDFDVGHGSPQCSSRRVTRAVSEGDGSRPPRGRVLRGETGALRRAPRGSVRTAVRRCGT